MRIKTVTRYFCGFCSKGMFKKPDMIQHEAGCTKNPYRKCWLCEDANTFSLKEIVEELKKRQPVQGDEIYSENLQWIREKTGNCPACILSALRQSDLQAWDQFEYKAEKQEWEAEKSRELRDTLQ